MADPKVGFDAILGIMSNVLLILDLEEAFLMH